MILYRSRRDPRIAAVRRGQGRGESVLVPLFSRSVKGDTIRQIESDRW